MVLHVAFGENVSGGMWFRMAMDATRHATPHGDLQCNSRVQLEALEAFCLAQMHLA